MQLPAIRVQHQRSFDLIEMPIMNLERPADIAASETLDKLFVVVNKAWRSGGRQVQ